MSENKELETKKAYAPIKNFANLLTDFDNRLLILLGDAEKVARFKSIAVSVFGELKPDLQHKLNLADFGKKVIEIAQLDIMPSRYNMYVVPFGNTVTIMLTIKALQSIVNRSNYYITTFVIREKDNRKINLLDLNNSFIEPSFEDSPAVQYVALMKDKQTGKILDCEIMSVTQIEAHKNKFSKQADGTFWTGNFDEMARKTVFKRLVKRVGFDPATEDALSKVNEIEHVETVESAPAPKWKDNINLTQEQLESVSTKLQEQKLQAETKKEQIEVPF